MKYMPFRIMYPVVANQLKKKVNAVTCKRINNWREDENRND